MVDWFVDVTPFSQFLLITPAVVSEIRIRPLQCSVCCVCLHRQQDKRDIHMSRKVTETPTVCVFLTTVIFSVLYTFRCIFGII